MSNRYPKALLFAALVLAAAPAVAQQQGKPARPAAVADPAAQAFRGWDKDHNGSLSLAEFRAGWQQVQRMAETQARLRHQFATVDANHSGAIEAAEYGNLVLVKNAGKSAPPLARFDANADGKLQFAEYLKLVQGMAPAAPAKGAAK
jgi:Ca2+-binding EF-hand superfamily protein